MSVQRTLANLVLNRGGIGEGDQIEQPATSKIDDRGLKIEVPEFDANSLDPEDYLDWERSLERFFDYKGTQEEQKIKLAKLKLGRTAQHWLEGKQLERAREGRPKIQTWSKLKKYLRRRFVPTNYQQQLYVKWSGLRQGNRTVVEYLKEFEKLSVACQIEEREELRTGRFIGGLEEYIKEKLETHSNVGFDEACRVAHTYEKQKKKTKSFPTNSSIAGASSKFDQSSMPKGVVINETKPKEVAVNEANISKGKEVRAYKDVKCFKCLGNGHYQKDCPNMRALTALEIQELQESPLRFSRSYRPNVEEHEQSPLALTHSEERFGQQRGILEDSTDEEEDVGATQRNINLLSRFALHSSLMKGGDEQRETIFHSKCEVGEKVCSLIIDGGSCRNIIASEVVEKLNLPTSKLEDSYRLKWLDDSSELKVRKKVLLAFAIGPYKDEVECDVIPMNACHVLLGRPWQFDRRVKHDGFQNTYSLKVGRKKYTLRPMKPSEIRSMVVELKTSFFSNQSEAKRVKQEVRRAATVREEIMANNRDYTQGELVWVDVSHGKFSNKDKKHKRELIEENTAGPFKVVEKTRQGSYLIELSTVPSICARFEKEEISPYFDQELMDLRANPLKEGGFEPCLGMVQDQQAMQGHAIT